MQNWKGNKFVERFIREWILHKKVVLACDFDDTVFPWSFKSDEDLEYQKEIIRVIKLAENLGIYLVIWSACDADRYNDIRKWCLAHDLRIASINENPIPLPYGNNRKMYYNHLLDDRAGLEQALDMLEYACYRVESERRTPTNNFDV